MVKFGASEHLFELFSLRVQFHTSNITVQVLFSPETEAFNKTGETFREVI